MRRYPSISAIVEWENARLAGAARARRTLSELVAQIGELSAEVEGKPELIIVYERGAVDRAAVAAAVQAVITGEPAFDVRFHATKGANYYQQKNAGAALAVNDYLLFLDSDVVPEPGWLRALLDSLRQPGVQVAGGNTYVDPASFAGRAFGLFWFFPLRAPSAGVRPSPYFFANNLLVRRDLFLALRFPDLPLYRGQCSALGRTLRSRGIQLFMQTDARVAHPPPWGPRLFIRRAFREGYDLHMRARLARQPRRDGFRDLLDQLATMRRRVGEGRGQLDMGPAEAGAAAMLGTVYLLLRFLGQRFTAAAPDRARRMLGI